MKKRVVDNWKSTLIGAVIAICCGLAMYYKYATFDQVVGFLTVSGLLAWVKDSIFHADATN